MTQVRELREGSRVASVLMLRSVDLRRRRDGDEYLKLTLANRSGTLPAVVLSDVDAAREVCRSGQPVHVDGVFSVHPAYGGRLVVEAVRPAAPDEYDPEALRDGPTRPAAQMEADLRELIATVQDPHLRRLLTATLGADAETWPRFRDAPAAKHYHQAYRHGLLEHSLTVAQAVSAISATFPGIDRDVAVTGALLHDIGKLDAYELRGDMIEMSDQGRLYGEIPLGYYRVRSLIESLEGFPDHCAQAVLHIILSHHGSLEHGSPVVPCTREATLVHMADNLGGRLGSFDRVEKALPAGSQWSPFDKGIGGGAYFAVPAVDQRRAA
ncbi:MAG TPA: HD domain-containing protein [Solirubrobacteraceae bacterium]|jgi:3'-5' exoribonuclease